MLYIRTDMNNKIAMGHLMRCLAIADAAKSCGEEVTFILADEQAVSYVCERGFQSVVLGTEWENMESELPAITKVIKEKQMTSLLIDSYLVTEKYLAELSKYVKIIYLDDLNLFRYPVDVIVCYANYFDKFCYTERYQDTKLLLGTKYMPMRKEFSQIGAKEISDKVEKLLLLSGGTDSRRVMERILEELDTSKFEQITVICGKYHDRYQELVEKYQNCSNVKILQNVQDIENHMLEADLAVSAGGTTLYELCACGTPAISYSFVDNQLDNVKRFSEDGYIDYAGDARTDDIVVNILKLVNKYYEDKALRHERSVKMQGLVDGKGAKRIVLAWKELQTI